MRMSKKNSLIATAAAALLAVGAGALPAAASAAATTTTFATLPSGASPWGIALDSSGNVYTANAALDTVSKINSSGTIVATYATGDNPHGIAIDSAGNKDITSRGSSRVASRSRRPTRAVSGPSARRPRNSVKASPEGAFTPRRRDRRTAHARSASASAASRSY